MNIVFDKFITEFVFIGIAANCTIFFVLSELVRNGSSLLILLSFMVILISSITTIYLLDDTGLRKE